MKTKSYYLLMLMFAVGLCADAVAAENREFPRVSLIGPGASKNPLSRDEYISVVVEGPFLSFDKTPIPADGEAEYLDKLIKTKSVSYIAVYTREGIKYGDLIRAIDVLRHTTAKNIGISMIELKPGREP